MSWFKSGLTTTLFSVFSPARPAAVEPTGASRRRGYEIVAFWKPLPWLAIDGNYTAAHARYDNGDHIPNAFESAASAGLSLIADPWGHVVAKCSDGVGWATARIDQGLTARVRRDMPVLEHRAARRVGRLDDGGRLGAP